VLIKASVILLPMLSIITIPFMTVNTGKKCMAILVSTATYAIFTVSKSFADVLMVSGRCC